MLRLHALALALAVAVPAAWLLASLLAAAVLPGSAPASLTACARAAALVCAGVLLRPALPPGRASALAWTAALALLALAWAPGGTGRVALGVAVVLLFAAAFDAAAARFEHDPRARARALLAVLALAGTSPLWGGPLGEQAGATAAGILVALSPLSLLAALAGHDYLRDPWFYAHSAFGTLRVAQPGAWALVAGHLGASALLLAAARVGRPSTVRSTDT